MKSFFRKLWRDESGQGATEYILMLVVIVVIVMAFKERIVGIIKGKTDEMGGRLGKVFE